MRESALVISLACSLGNLSLHAGPAPEEKEYAVDLSRHYVKGEKYKIYGRGTSAAETCTYDRDGQVVNKNVKSLETECLGKMEVTAVTASGDASRYVIDMARCESVEDDVKTVLVKPGGRLFVEKVPYAVNGKASTPRPFRTDDDVDLPGSASEALDLLFSRRYSEPPIEEGLFGTRDRKKVGASWPMDLDFYARFMRDQGYEVKRDATSGSARLAGVSRVGSVECLDLVFTVRGRLVPIQQDASQTVDHIETTMSGSIRLPLDRSLPAPEFAFEDDTEMVVLQNGSNMRYCRKRNVRISVESIR